MANRTRDLPIRYFQTSTGIEFYSIGIHTDGNGDPNTGIIMTSKDDGKTWKLTEFGKPFAKEMKKKGYKLVKQ